MVSSTCAEGQVVYWSNFKYEVILSSRLFHQHWLTFHVAVFCGLVLAISECLVSVPPHSISFFIDPRSLHKKTASFMSPSTALRSKPMPIAPRLQTEAIRHSNLRAGQRRYIPNLITADRSGCLAERLTLPNVSTAWPTERRYFFLLLFIAFYCFCAIPLIVCACSAQCLRLQSRAIGVCSCAKHVFRERRLFPFALLLKPLRPFGKLLF